MLPHAPLRLGLTEIKGVSVPAREVGGDFFNYFAARRRPGRAARRRRVRQGRRRRAADGQHPGVAADAAARSARTCRAIADAIDRDIEANSPGPVYATLFVGILDPATRVLRYVNAGHNPQFVLRRDGALEQMYVDAACRSACSPAAATREQRVQLAAGDLLFFYTDGCVEAENESGEMFGAERLEALLHVGVIDEPGRPPAARGSRRDDVPRRARAVRRRDDDGGQGRVTHESFSTTVGLSRIARSAGTRHASTDTTSRTTATSRT